MIPIVLEDWVRERLQPHLDRNVAGLGKFTADELVDKINAVPDTVPMMKRERERAADLDRLANEVYGIRMSQAEKPNNDKALLMHYWSRLTGALAQRNDEAAAGWLVAVMLAFHATGFLIPKARGKIEQEKTLPAGQVKGTAANAIASANRHMALEGAVADYCARLKQTTWSTAGCLKWMKNHTHDAEGKLIKEPDRYYINGKFCGYERSTAERYIREILGKRKSQ